MFRGRARQRGFISAADKDRGPPGKAERTLRQDGEMLGRPALGHPPRTDSQGEPRPRTVAQELRGPTAFRLANGHAKHLSRVSDAERLSHEPVTIDRVNRFEIGDLNRI